jgi:hypothetical protein
MGFLNAGLPPLASADDVASRLGRDLTGVEAVKVEPLLRDASALVRRYCKRDFLCHVEEVVPALYGRDGEIQLPYRPVDDVSQVMARGSDNPALDLPDLPVPWYTFDGVDRVILDPGWGAIINLPEVWWTSELYPGTFDVTMSWGSDYANGPPDDVLLVTVNEAIGVLMAPTLATAVIGETVGPYSWRAERTGGGTMIALSQAGQVALKDYRRGTGTMIARLR